MSSSATPLIEATDSRITDSCGARWSSSASVRSIRARFARWATSSLRDFGHAVILGEATDRPLGACAVVALSLVGRVCDGWLLGTAVGPGSGVSEVGVAPTARPATASPAAPGRMSRPGRLGALVGWAPRSVCGPRSPPRSGSDQPAPSAGSSAESTAGSSAWCPGPETSRQRHLRLARGDDADAAPSRPLARSRARSTTPVRHHHVGPPLETAAREVSTSPGDDVRVGAATRRARETDHTMPRTAPRAPRPAPNPACGSPRCGAVVGVVWSSHPRHAKSIPRGKSSAPQRDATRRSPFR